MFDNLLLLVLLPILFRKVGFDSSVIDPNVMKEFLFIHDALITCWTFIVLFPSSIRSVNVISFKLESVVILKYKKVLNICF